MVSQAIFDNDDSSSSVDWLTVSFQFQGSNLLQAKSTSWSLHSDSPKAISVALIVVMVALAVLMGVHSS